MTRTWTVEQVAASERALEERVSNAARDLERAKKWHRAALAELRKFRKAKIKHAAQIVPSHSSPERQP